MEEKREHAILSASSAHRWLTCTPSARLELEEGIEEGCSVYAEEGTAAHALAELKLSYMFGNMTDEDFNAEYDRQKQGKYYNGEFEEYVDNYVNYVKETYKDEIRGKKNTFVFIEVKVNFSNVVPQGFGTSDALIVTEDTIHVIDLKFGAGVPVSAIGNPQLRLYAMGALNMFPNTKYIKVSIVQPRLESTSTDELTKKELVDWAFNEVKPKAEMAIKGEGTLNASENACRFCKLKGKCKARADMQLAEARREFAPVIRDNGNLAEILTPDKIGNILQIAPVFEKWFEDVKAYALGQLTAGVKIPGYKLVEGRSNRTITDTEAVKTQLQNIGFKDEDIMEPAKMKSLTNLEKLVGKKMFNQLCGEYITKPAGKLTLAPEDDRRPEFNTIELAKSDFAEPIE